jgi:hypothetical protein
MITSFVYNYIILGQSNIGRYQPGHADTHIQRSSC